ncbi:MAG TPA: hypothetical protein VK790_06395 [Solirubrobacteraceae bacterium]|jgi:hypothetical protein|nr:hypothetical protein [Solirubrobacteraceae bacterium]
MSDISELLSSVKADLTDRRLLPLVALVAAALVGAIAYVVIGGGSSAPTSPSAATNTPATASAGVAISQASPEKAVAEMTGGVSVQHHGSARNPFTPLPAEKTASTASSSSKSSGSGSSSSSSSGSSSTGSPETSSTGGSGTTKPSKPSTPAKPKTVYHVAVLFGALPAGSTPQTAQLTPYESLKLLQPLPEAKQPLIVFRGVTSGGKSATFTLVGEAILHGEAACLPSASQCEAIDLQPGKAEQLEYLTATGQPALYELRVVSIVSAKASSAAVKSQLRGESKAGRELLQHAGLLAVPDLHYSAQMGVLVFAAHHAFGARAGAAAHRRHGR